MEYCPIVITWDTEIDMISELDINRHYFSTGHSVIELDTISALDIALSS